MVVYFEVLLEKKKVSGSCNVLHNQTGTTVDINPMNPPRMSFKQHNYVDERTRSR
jgi:hypothetical protein